MAEILQALVADMSIAPDARVVDMRMRAATIPGVDANTLTWAMMVRRLLLQHDVRTYRRMAKRTIRPLIADADPATLACISVAVLKTNALRKLTVDQTRQLLLAACARKKRKTL
jgi:hypothetical protein